jgi:hypothetical protein
VTVGFRLILAIRQLIMLALLAIAEWVVLVIAFFAVLFTGRWPAGLRHFTLAVLRCWLRVEAYLLPLTDEYPPFALDGDRRKPWAHRSRDASAAAADARTAGYLRVFDQPRRMHECVIWWTEARTEPVGRAVPNRGTITCERAVVTHCRARYPRQIISIAMPTRVRTPPH